MSKLWFSLLTVILYFTTSIEVCSASIQTDSTTIQINNLQDKDTAPNFCLLVVLEIIMASESYKQATAGLEEAVIANGGLGITIVIEGSPNPEDDKAFWYSDNYEISVKENYEDRMVNVARYAFQPQTGNLYKENVVEAILEPILYPINLLCVFQNRCNK